MELNGQSRQPSSEKEATENQLEQLKSRVNRLHSDIVRLLECTRLSDFLQKMYEIREGLNRLEQGLLQSHLKCCISPTIRVPEGFDCLELPCNPLATPVRRSWEASVVAYVFAQPQGPGEIIGYQLLRCFGRSADVYRDALIIEQAQGPLAHAAGDDDLCAFFRQPGR
jgi:hypothetical protein